jgi:protein gp37
LKVSPITKKACLNPAPDVGVITMKLITNIRSVISVNTTLRMNKTKIEWTDYTWNPVTGCTKVSQGCKNCYAETLTTRFGKQWGKESFRDVSTHPERLDEPVEMGRRLHGKKVFVCDMSDLFHESVPFIFILAVFDVMKACHKTTFQVLTKRIDRAHALLSHLRLDYDIPKNMWLGTSCEDQKTADERIPFLLKIPASVRFLSCEPLLGPINLREVARFVLDGRVNPLCWIDALDCVHPVKWVIAGGESGHNGRPMHPDWVRSIRDQCADANVPFFFKQWGEFGPDSHVSFNGPFFIQGVKHYLVNINGEAYPYGNVWLNEKLRYTDKENERAQQNQLTKEDNAYWMAKVGKKEAGNLLDGKTHLEFPTL